jgi:hypothetical protein
VLNNRRRGTVARVDRTIRRIQEKKTMKNRIKNLRMAAQVAFKAGKEAVLFAAHGLSYGEGYEVKADTTDSVGGDVLPGSDIPDAGVPVVNESLGAPKPSVPFIIPA